MNNLKPGDILTKKDGAEIKVIAVFGDRVWTTTKDQTDPCGCTDVIKTLISNGWTKKEEPWMPKMGDCYWFIDTEGDTLPSRWSDDLTDQARASFLGVFLTEEAAIKRRDEIIKLIRK